MSNQSVTNIANAIINKINSLISSHNNNSNAHQDIRNSIPKIFYAACDCSEQNRFIELECEDWNTEQGNIIYVRFNNVDNHYSTYIMDLNINEEPIPVHNTIDFYNNITPLILFRDAVVKFTCYFIDENTPIFLYEFPTLISELYNDIGLITSSSVPSASNTTPSADTTNGSVGDGTTWARSDHTHPKSSLYAEASHTHSDADITTFGFYRNLPQANFPGPSQQLVNSAINSAMGDKEDNANKVTSLSSSSTDTQYPSAKAVYDAIFSLDTLDCINENFTILSLPQITFTHDGNPFDGSTIHILEGYDKGAYVDWGDGTPIETYESTDTLEHSYSDSVREHIITIYGDILNLYNNSFENFIRMTSINIPSGVTSLGNNCFNGCTSLTNVTIPSGVTSLGDNCFRYCALTNVTIPSSVISLGNYCFSSCSSLTSVTIPNGVTSLGDNCFRYCSVLTNVTIPSSVTSLGDYCFSGCSSLTSVTISSSVTSLGNNCFNNCPNLTNVTIPSSVTSLGNNCFNSCSSLTSVTIPNGVRSLGVFCFNGCTGLTSVVIPSSVISLGANCFSGCTNLVDYQLYWETPPVNWSSTRMPNNTDTYFTIPNGTTANYTAKGFPSDKLVERSE